MSYFVIGHPIGHSRSPAIHRRLFQLSGKPAGEDCYQACDIPPEQMDTLFPALLKRAEGIHVTIPHKQAVIRYLDGLSGTAALVQAVNTIACEGGKWIGYNTDTRGFRAALEDRGIPLQGTVLLLGAGGAGRALACECALAGCRIINAVRPSGLPAAEQLREFVLSLPNLPPEARHYTVTTLPRLAEDHTRYDLLINATPVGMYPHPDASPVPQPVVDRCGAVFDAVYNPEQTRLLQMAARAGIPAVGGMPMLVWQAAEAHTIWYGAAFQPADIRRLIAQANQDMRQLFGHHQE